MSYRIWFFYYYRFYCLFYWDRRVFFKWILNWDLFFNFNWFFGGSYWLFLFEWVMNWNRAFYFYFLFRRCSLFNVNKFFLWNRLFNFYMMFFRSRMVDWCFCWVVLFGWYIRILNWNFMNFFRSMCIFRYVCFCKIIVFLYRSESCFIWEVL